MNILILFLLLSFTHPTIDEELMRRLLGRWLRRFALGLLSRSILGPELVVGDFHHLDLRLLLFLLLGRYLGKTADTFLLNSFFVSMQHMLALTWCNLVDISEAICSHHTVDL